MLNPEFSHIHVPKCGGSWVDTFFKHAFPGKLIHSSHGSLSNILPIHWIAWRSGLGPMKDGHPLWDVDFRHQTLEFGLQLATMPEYPGRFANSVKVSTCRNPFDWLVSYYYCGQGGFGEVRTIHGIRSFEEFVEKFCDPTFKWFHFGLHKFIFFQQFDNEGANGMQWILRMEKLKQALDMMFLHYGADPESLKRAWAAFGEDHTSRDSGNVSKDREHKDHRFYYDDRLREIATKRFEGELTLYRYNFDGPTDESPIVDIPRSWGTLITDPDRYRWFVMNR